MVARSHADGLDAFNCKLAAWATEVRGWSEDLESPGVQSTRTAASIMNMHLPRTCGHLGPCHCLY